MSTGKLYITHTHSNVVTHFSPFNYQTLCFFSTRCRVEECCFLWGFNSLFTAVLLVQNPFLEANANQSNFMSVQQGLSGPTVGVSREQHSCTFTKRNKAAEATSAPSFPSISDRRHASSPMLLSLTGNKAHCLQLLFVWHSIFRPPWCFLAKFFRLLQGWRGENPSRETKSSFCKSWTVEVGLLCCRDAIFHLTRPGVIHCEQSGLTKTLYTC